MTLAGRAYCKQLPVCLLLACVASLFLICLVTLAPSFLALDFLGPLYMGAVPSVVSMWSLQGPSPCLGGEDAAGPPGPLSIPTLTSLLCYH